MAALPDPALPDPALPDPALPLHRPIDPFCGSVDGRYEDDAVIVLRRDTLSGLSGEPWTTTTRHFALGREPGRGRLLLAHALPPDQVDNDLAMLIDGELFAPGWAGGADTFERLMTGVVLSCHDDALAAWESFYRATLTRLAVLLAHGSDVALEAGSTVEGTLAAFAPVYDRAETLVHEAGTHTLLDLGSCFGFFPMRMAAGDQSRALTVQAADISPGACDLLRRISVRLGTPVPVLVCDAACVPIPDREVDTVTLLHVLEHVDAGHGHAILAEAVRLARRRVVVAVPLENEPDAAFGHLRTISLADLAAWGAEIAASGPWQATVSEFHGGWLVIDRSE